jgi:hypothetical protein
VELLEEYQQLVPVPPQDRRNLRRFVWVGNEDPMISIRTLTDADLGRFLAAIGNQSNSFGSDDAGMVVRPLHGKSSASLEIHLP